jgi:hypothetical protein
MDASYIKIEAEMEGQCLLCPDNLSGPTKKTR